jgi:hypothetical protein
VRAAVDQDARALAKAAGQIAYCIIGPHSDTEDTERVKATGEGRA